MLHTPTNEEIFSQIDSFLIRKDENCMKLQKSLGERSVAKEAVLFGCLVVVVVFSCCFEFLLSVLSS